MGIPTLLVFTDGRNVIRSLGTQPRTKNGEKGGIFPKSRSLAFGLDFTVFFCCHFVAVSIGLYSQKMEVGISVIVEKASIQCIPIISILMNFPESSWFISSRSSPVNLCLGGCITIHIALTPISNIAKKNRRCYSESHRQRGPREGLSLSLSLSTHSLSLLSTQQNRRCYSESHRQRGPREGGNRARENAARDETEQLHNLDKIDKVGQIMPRHLSLSFR